MESGLYTLCELFSQLGMPNAVPAIHNFIAQHRPLAPSIKLSAAPFWNQAQREFLQHAISEDADWSAVVDQLDTRLR